jgi:hypothetical protein
MRLRGLGDPNVLAVQGLRIGAIQTVGRCSSFTSNGCPGHFGSFHAIFCEGIANAASVDAGSLYQKVPEPIKLRCIPTRFCEEFPMLLPA